MCKSTNSTNCLITLPEIKLINNRTILYLKWKDCTNILKQKHCLCTMFYSERISGFVSTFMVKLPSANRVLEAQPQSHRRIVREWGPLIVNFVSMPLQWHYPVTAVPMITSPPKVPMNTRPRVHCSVHCALIAPPVITIN